MSTGPIEKNRRLMRVAATAALVLALSALTACDNKRVITNTVPASVEDRHLIAVKQEPLVLTVDTGRLSSGDRQEINHYLAMCAREGTRPALHIRAEWIVERIGCFGDGWRVA